MTRPFWTLSLLAACAVSAGAQMTSLALNQSSYKVSAGQPVTIDAPSDTVETLLSAKSRTVTPVSGTNGITNAAFTVGPNRAGNAMLLATSLRTPAGEYAVTLSATNSSGQTSQIAMDITVSPQQTVPSSATRAPVVLLNGWETGYTNACPISSSSSDTFGNLAQYLADDGVPVVYFFDNCAEGADQTIEALASDLSTFLNSITYDTGAPVAQIDIVGFSLGGLIVRDYLAGLQTNETLTPPASTLVHNLVLIATPNFGSFVAANFTNIIPTGTQSAELVPGSSFLWNLATWNQHTDDLRGVNAIAVIGNAGTYTNTLTGASVAGASDGVVSTTSASLGFVAQNAVVTRIVPYCQVDPTAFTNTSLEPYYCNAPGIANVTDTSQYTGQIVRSFLAGNTTWESIGTTPATDVYLSVDGGTYFGALNDAGGYVSDLTQVLWGTLTLLAGGDTGTIFYDDFIAGTGTFEASSSSLGSIDCGAITQATGYFVAARCKINTTIESVGPLENTSGKIVPNGAAITITGVDFGALCNGCKVVATPAGASSGASLSVSSWTAGSITAQLPASLSGLVTIGVYATTGSDSINIMVAAPAVVATPALSVSAASLQFTSTNGSNIAEQSIQITNTGAGTLAWTASASDSWIAVSPGSGTAPSTMSISVNPSGMAAGTYNGSVQIAASGATGSPATVAITLTVSQTQNQTTPGTITGVSNAGSFQPGFASATWVSIFGTNLSQVTYTWQASDFVNGQLPTTLQEVSVTVNGTPAYVEYVSPTQINVLAPDGLTAGNVEVQVTTNSQVSGAFTAAAQQFAPAFFTISGGTAIAAEHADYSLIGPAGLFSNGPATTPAQPGETIILYGTGFGPTTPAIATGQLVTTAEPLANQVQITIGGVGATVEYAGVVESGLYQFNVTVPASVPSGNAAVVASVGGVQTQTGVTLAVQ